MSAAPNPVKIPDFAVIECKVDIARPASEAWKKIGDFGDAGRFLKVHSKVISGNGGVGSVREIGDHILEVKVSASSNSYAYAQTVGPMAIYAYHGAVELESTGTDTSRLHYTLIYDQSEMDKPAQAQQAARVKDRFQGMAETMKREAEAQP